MHPKQGPLCVHTCTVRTCTRARPCTHTHACILTCMHRHACSHTKRAHRHAHKQAGTRTCTHSYWSCGCGSNGHGVLLSGGGIAHGVSRCTGSAWPCLLVPPHGVCVSFPPVTGSHGLLTSLPQRGPLQPILSPEGMRCRCPSWPPSTSLVTSGAPICHLPLAPPPAQAASQAPASSRSGATTPQPDSGWSISPGRHPTHPTRFRVATGSVSAVSTGFKKPGARAPAASSPHACTALDAVGPLSLCPEWLVMGEWMREGMTECDPRHTLVPSPGASPGSSPQVALGAICASTARGLPGRGLAPVTGQ